MRRSILLCVFALLVFGKVAFADIFKCVSEDGVVTFSDQPCGEKAALVIHDKKLSVDEAIGNASPYPEPVIYSSNIDTDVLLHARKIGKSIFPNDMLKSHDLTTEHTGIYYSWKVFLSYVTPQKEHMWSRMVLDYRGDRKDDKILVRLKYISIKRFDWFNPIPTLKNTTKLKKDAHYGWHVISSQQ